MYTSLVAKICLAAFAALVVGCSFQSVKPGEDSQFIVQQIDTLKHQDVQGDQSWQTTIQREYTVNLCYADRLTSEKIIDQEFRVESQFSSQSLRTDQKGCGEYHFSTDVNMLTEQRFVEMDLKTHRSNDQEDRSEVKLFFNPWTNRIIDGRYQEVNQPVRSDDAEDYVNASAQSPFSVADSLEERSVGYNFGLDSIKLISKEDSHLNADVISVQFESRPWVKYLLEAQKVQKITPEQGRVQVSAVLVDEGDVVARTASQPIVDISLGRITIESLDLDIFKNVDPFKDLKLYFKISPLNNDDLTPWAGYALVNLNKLKSDLSREVVNSEVTAFDKFFQKNVKSEVSRQSESADKYIQIGRKNQTSGPVYVKSQRFSFVGLQSENVASSLVTAGVAAQICLSYSTSERPVSDKDVKIGINRSEDLEVAPSSWESVRTDKSGCINQKLEHHFFYFDEVEYLPFHTQIQFEDDEKVYFIKGYINPWLGAHQNFYWPDEFSHPPQVDAVEEAHFRLQNASYEIPAQQEVFYTDQYLNLRREEVFYLKLTPSITRNVTGLDKNYHHLRAEKLWADSEYKLDFVLVGHTPLPAASKVQSRLANYRLISRFKAVAKADSQGDIQLAVPYSYFITERPIVEASLRILVRMEQVGTGALPSPSIFELHFDPLKEGINRSSIVSNEIEDLDWTQIISDLKPESHSWKELALSSHTSSEVERFVQKHELLKPVLKSEKDPFKLFVERSDFKNVVIADLDQSDSLIVDRLDDLDFDIDSYKDLVEKFSAEGQNKLPKEIAQFCRLFARVPAFSSTQYRSLRDYDVEKISHREQSCVKNPFKYFDVDIFQFAQPDTQVAMHKTDHSSTNFTVTNSVSIATVDSKRWDDGKRNFDRKEAGARVDAGGSVEGGFNFFGTGVKTFASAGVFGTVGVGQMNYTAVTESHGTQKRKAINTNENVVLHLQGRTFEADLSLRTCALVTPAKGSSARMASAVCRGGNCKGILVCQSSKKRMQESWYYLTDRSHGSLDNPRDKRAVFNRKWVMALRGADRLNDFKDVLTGEKGNLVLFPQSFKSFGSDHLNSDMKKLGMNIQEDQGIGVFPGLIRHAQVTGHKVVESAEKRYEAKPKNNVGRPNWSLYKLDGGDKWRAKVDSISPSKVTITVYKNQWRIGQYTLDHTTGSYASTRNYKMGANKSFGRKMHFSYNEKQKSCRLHYEYLFAGSDMTNIHFNKIQCSHEDLSSRR